MGQPEPTTRSHSPHQNSLLKRLIRGHGPLWWAWLLLLCAAALALIASTNQQLASSHIDDSPIKRDSLLFAASGGVPPPLNIEQHQKDERVLRMLIEECAKGEDSAVFIDNERDMVVQQHLDLKHCPVLDVMLRGNERSIGACTDVALYVLHAGARLIAFPQPNATAYDAACGRRTARLFLPDMHEEFLSDDPEVLHLLLVAPEQLRVPDAWLHRRMAAYLCKTKACKSAMRAHVRRTGQRASVWLVGHSSSDPTVDTARGPMRPVDTQGFLHVKGTSGRKHTRELLECWTKRSDFPMLTVVGHASGEELKLAHGKKNIQLLPAQSPNHIFAEQAAATSGLVPFQELRRLQVQTPVHVCTTERDSFGHYLNEARAAGALIITTDHAPMNELVTGKEGMLVAPDRVFSHLEMSLRPTSALAATLSAGRICGAVIRVLQLTHVQVAEKGAAARAAYEANHSAFLARVAELARFLRQHAEGNVQHEHVGLGRGLPGGGSGALVGRRGSARASWLFDLSDDVMET